MTEPATAAAALPPLADPLAPADERGRAIEARIMARTGCTPTLEHYRRAYARRGLEVDDETIRARHLVADPAA